MTREQRQTVLQAAERMGAREGCIVRLLSGHAMRASEVAGLTLQDLNFRDATIRIRRLKGSITTVEAFMPGDAEALQAWLAVKPAGELLFAGPNGRPLTRVRIYQIVRQVAEMAGLPSTMRAPHSFRHTLGQMMANGGASNRMIQLSMGHRSINSTAQYFSHPQAQVDSTKAAMLQ